MKFKLNIPERLAILSILPTENNFVNLRLIRESISKIGFSDEETIEFEVKQVGENVSFNAEKGLVEKTIEIGERAYALICEVLEDLDQTKKLTQNHFSIYEKFINMEK